MRTVAQHVQLSIWNHAVEARKQWAEVRNQIPSNEYSIMLVWYNSLKDIGFSNPSEVAEGL